MEHDEQAERMEQDAEVKRSLKAASLVPAK